MKKKLALLAIGGVIFSSCGTDQEIVKSSPSQNQPLTKIANSSENALQDQVIVKFTEEGLHKIESIVLSSPTKSIDAVQVDALLGSIGITKVEPVFNVNKNNSERAKKSGLHLWYVLHFGETRDVNEVAAQLANKDIVSVVEFSSKYVKNSTGKTVSYKPSGLAPRTDLPFSDSYLADQWNFNNTGDSKFATKPVEGADVNVFDAWTMSTGDPSIIVAVLDEAVQYNHPDLEANMWVNADEIPGNGIDDDENGLIDDIHGWDFASDGPISWGNLDDNGDLADQGHGTHVAGVIAAVNNNGIGISSIAGGSGNNDGVRLMSCQIFASNSASSAQIAKAITYAADNGASILQCSFGKYLDNTPNDNAFENKSPMEVAAYEYFLSAQNNDVIDGGLIIFASGNDKDPRANYPGAYRKFISVSSVSADHLPTWYTNYGTGVNISATGGSAYTASNNKPYGMILSTTIAAVDENKAEYSYKEGTSMACPHVSGIAALGLSYAKQLGKTFTTEEFKSMLLTSTNDIDAFLEGVKYTPAGSLTLPNYIKKMGTGLVDATQFLLQIEGAPMLKAKVNTKQYLSLNKFFGGSSDNLTYLGVEISEEDKTKLGLEEDLEIKSGKLVIKCAKPGMARVTIKAIAGGNNVASPDQMGGMPIEKEVVIIARTVQTSNGGWL